MYMDKRIWPNTKSEFYKKAERWWGYADKKVGWLDTFKLAL